MAEVNEWVTTVGFWGWFWFWTIAYVVWLVLLAGVRALGRAWRDEPRSVCPCRMCDPSSKSERSSSETGR